MTGLLLEIQLVAVVTAVACALPGVFLVLRRTAMLSDAISHAILLGIVLAFFVARDLSSPLLIAGAAGMGILTVTLVELLTRTRLVKEDAAIGLVFPALFSLGVILIARYAGNVHLDTDSVLLGELAFAPLNRLVAAGSDLGPKSLWVMAGILVLGLAFILIFYKELKLSTFDAGLAAVLGFSPAALHYALMALVSVTAVGAFDAVGSVLVVALMIAPPATAYLLADSLEGMLILSAVAGVVSAVGGFWAAYALDVSIAGAMATATGTCFLCAYLWAPERGLVAVARRRRRQRWEFAETMLAIHLHQHEDRPEAASELREDHLVEHLAWTAAFARDVVQRAERHGTLVRRAGSLELTPPGRKLAREALAR